MPATGPQNDWVRRALGLSVGEPGTIPSPPPLRPETDGFGPLTTDLQSARKNLIGARDTMLAALSKADAQIRKLQAVLAVHPDPDLKDIAAMPELGINGLTGGYRARTLLMLRNLQDAPPEKLPTLLQRSRALVAGFNEHIRTSDRIEACDKNPLGIAVSVRALLGPALAELARNIENFAA